MEHVYNTQKFIAALFGAILAPVFKFFYGDTEMVFYIVMALFFFIGLDWITGTRASKKDNSYASKYGLDGVFRTFFILLLPAGGHLLDKVFGSPDIIFGLLSFGVLYHVIQSMTANAIRAGWGNWFPDWILSKITDWVKSELESKLARSEQRKSTKSDE
ncbi:hypothetical protein J6TS2_33700 [Heyndrickxia sporothermodurans]|nr:hypothetical protein J6TS2_33700 [Heyndrickxia sporothermodurans]